MTKEEIIDNIARLNSETWRDREEVRMEIGKLLAELKKALEQPTSNDYEYNRGYRDGYDKGNLNGYELRKAEEKKSEDCVSRQAVTDTVENTIAKYIPTFIGQYEKIPLELARAIKNVPPVTPTQRWIPVSERLPEKYGYYLCSLYYAIPPYHILHPEDDTYIHDVSVQKFDGESFCASVKAWMELPKPYEEKRGNEDGRN